MRHGESLANVASAIVSDPGRGVSRFGLTERGRRQVKEKLSLLGEVTCLYSSDFLRARETAEIVREGLGLSAPLHLTPLLRERYFGSFESRSSDNYPEIWRRDRDHPEEPGDGIETVNSVLTRACMLVDQVSERHPGEVVLCVCHGDVAQILLAHGQGLAAEHHRQIAHIETAGIREFTPSRQRIRPS